MAAAASPSRVALTASSAGDRGRADAVAARWAKRNLKFSIDSAPRDRRHRTPRPVLSLIVDATSFLEYYEFKL
jgi:hypothetical protein